MRQWRPDPTGKKLHIAVGGRSALCGATVCLKGAEVEMVRQPQICGECDIREGQRLARATAGQVSASEPFATCRCPHCGVEHDPRGPQHGMRIRRVYGER